MVVSASSLKSSDDAEVDIDLQFAQSPAKVICHNPARLPAALLRLFLFVSKAFDLRILAAVCAGANQT